MRRTVRFPVLLCAITTISLAVFPRPGQALTPYPVPGLPSTPVPASSSPRDFGTFGSLGLFDASDGETSAAFWRSDGTAAGTFPLVADCADCQRRQDFLVLDPSGPLSFFSVDHPRVGGELWVTGGRPSNTVRLAGFPFGGGPQGLARWVPEQGRLYFSAADETQGTELWTSDGTPAGTYAVTDIAPSGLTPFHGAIYFGGLSDGSGGSGGSGGLFKSDGTAQGTVEVQPTAPAGAPEALPLGLQVVSDRLLFFSAVPGGVLELWSSDGTSAGTAPVTATTTSFRSLETSGTAGSHLFFLVDDAQGENLWVSDGTRSGTRRLASFLAHPALPSFFQAMGNRMFFAADDGVHGRELWTSDGTVSGTHLVFDACPGKCWGAPYPLVPLGGQLFFEANDANSIDLWASDGSPQGTRKIHDLCPGGCSNNLSPRAFVVGKKLVFVAGDHPQDPAQLWATDGTPAGTRQLTSFTDMRLWSNGVEGAATATQLLFVGADPLHGQELWRTDGTPAGTRRVADIAPADLGGSFFQNLTAAADRVYFFSAEGTGGEAEEHSVLWASDGTKTTGTVRVYDFGAGTGAPQYGFSAAAVGRRLFFLYAAKANDRALWTSNGTAATTVRLTPPSVHVGQEIAALGSAVFFVADDGIHGPALFKSDGTKAGTRPVDPTGWSGGTATHFTVSGGRLFYFLEGGGDDFDSEELWRTDGTRAGTAHVADLHTGFSDENPALLAELSGRLYFFAKDAPIDVALGLWSTDGTEAGTRRVTSFGLGPNDSLESIRLAVAGGRLFLWIATYPDGASLPVPRLWVSDGTEAGTEPLTTTGQESSDPFQVEIPVDLSGRLFFLGPGSDPQTGSLWVSDGTVAGTGPVLGPAGRPIADPMSFRLFAGRVLFVAPDVGTDTLALWQTDGTPAGTRRVQTLGPENSGYGDDLTIAGARLYYRAYTPANGSELWALRPN